MHDKSTREDTIEVYLVAQAARYGGAALKLRPPKGRGFPDRTVALPGEWVAFVEVKRPAGGRVAKHQTTWGRDLVAYGQRFFIVSTYAEVDAIFNAYARSRL